MEHETAKGMLFYFLEGRNYNQDSGKLDFDIGYDLGDYSPDNKAFYNIARDCAQLLRTRLAGVFDDEGQIKQLKEMDLFGEFHNEK